MKSFLFSLLLGVMVCGSGECQPSAPIHLKVENQINPLGLDVEKPRFYWELQDTRRGVIQSAAQILVATTEEDLHMDKGTIWDTGKVSSSDSIHNVYGGSPLKKGTRYFWKVRVWTTPDGESPWSEIAWFETGLLSSDDWQAVWIGSKTASHQVFEGAQWIWHPEGPADNQQIYLRKKIMVQADLTHARVELNITADNRFSAYLNGKQVARARDWHSPVHVDLAGLLQTGENLLAVLAQNEEGPAGVLFALSVKLPDGQVLRFVSDQEVTTSLQRQDRWNEQSYPASDWSISKIVAAYGDAPWGHLSAGSPRSIYVRHDFQLKPGIRQARLYTTGLGLYHARLNGQAVTDALFTPDWTLYEKRIQYQTYDVTALVKSGKNALGAILGNGWYSSRMMMRVTSLPPVLMYLAQLEVVYEDGSVEIIKSDDSWKTFPSPILENSLYDGEIHDAQLEQEAWDQPDFQDSHWQAVEIKGPIASHLISQQCPPQRVTEEREAIAITEPKSGVYVFDFGQNLSGRAVLQVEGPAGTEVQIRFAEILNPDGTLYTENYRSARATDRYVLKGKGTEVWAPLFTYRGFRYAELTGYPGTPNQGSLKAQAIHSDLKIIGSFECSNPLLNQIHACISWGLRSNIPSVPTDCPQRDERLGWTGDIQAIAPTACWILDMSSFLSKWMKDLTDSQGPNGEVPDVAPVVNDPPKAGSPAWADAIIIIPSTVYRYYGDRRIIQDNYEGMKAWVEFMRRNAKDDLYEVAGYGDWVSIVPTPKEPIGSAYYYLSTRLLSSMAFVAGKEQDADDYAALANKIFRAFNIAYLDQRTHNYPGGTQAANLLPLAFGLVPPDRIELVFKNVVKDIESRGNHLSTGFLATPVILKVLSSMGKHDLAYALATETNYPSWGYMVSKGATTIWELWNSDSAGPGMNSRNHYALGSMGRWLYEDLAGINPDPLTPGFKEMIMKPRPAGDLTEVRASYQSLYGLIESHWKLEEGQFTLNLQIPANTSAKLLFPLLGSKEYQLREGETLLVENGKLLADTDGLQYIQTTDDSIAWKVGSGKYHLVLDHKGK